MTGPSLAAVELAPSAAERHARDLAWAAAIALLWVLLVQAGQARLDLSLGDEGMLWYGVQRTMAGHWPIRDFESYDVGRYFALAAWGKLVGSDGILALRCGLAVIEWAALVPAMLLVSHVVRNRWLQGVACGVLVVWMGPRHKIPDVAASVWATCALAYLASRPTHGRHVMAGVMVGLLWLVGMNHAAYAGVAAGGVTVVLALAGRTTLREWGARSFSLAAGVVVGALPMLLLLVCVRGFATGYWHNNLLPLVQLGGTNLPLPVQWPWRMGAPISFTSGAATMVGTAFGFLALPLVVLLGFGLIGWHAWRRALLRHPLLIATTATAAVWSHHAFARPDLSHLAQANSPALLLLIVMPFTMTGAARRAAQWTLWPAVLVVSLLTMPALGPLLGTRLTPGVDARWTLVHGERLYLPPYTARVCDAAATVAARMTPGESALFVPYVPGLYAVERLRCPMYESYPLFPASAADQQRVIDSLGRTRTDWVLYWPDHTDNRADLGFANTHPLVWKYIDEHFTAVPATDAPGGMVVCRRSH